MKIDIDGFTTFLALRDTRSITLNRHLRCLRQVAFQMEELSYSDTKKYIESQKLKGVSNMTLRNVLTTIRLYAQFMGVGEEIAKYPLPPRKQGVVRKTLSDSQIESFLNIPPRPHLTPIRHTMFTLFWHLLAFCALRPGEAARLKTSDLDLANNQITLRPEITKTDQFSTIPILPNVMEVIQNYLRQYKGDYLFPSKRGGTYNNNQEPVIDSGDWIDDFNYRLGAAGIEKVDGLVPYSLRHSCATRWISNDMSLYKVRRLMRHVKLEQTLVYEHMTSGHLVDSVVKYDPLVRKHSDPVTVLESAEGNLKNFGIFDDQRFSQGFKKKVKDAFFEEKQKLLKKKDNFF